MTPLDRFAANLRRARKGRGISQEALGFLAGLHRTHISLLERRGREPQLATLLKLASALDTDLDALCDGVRWLPEASRFEAA